jgi:hypothetical protein
MKTKKSKKTNKTNKHKKNINKNLKGKEIGELQEKKEGGIRKFFTSDDQPPKNKSEIKDFKDIKKELINLRKEQTNLASGLSNHNKDIQEIKSFIKDKAIDGLIRKKIEKYKEEKEELNKKNLINLDELQNQIENRDSKIQKLELSKSETDVQTLVNDKAMTDAAVEIEELRGEINKYELTVISKNKTINQLNHEKENSLTVTDDRKEKLEQIKTLFPNLNILLEKNPPDKEKFDILLEICFQINDLKEIKDIIDNPSLNSEEIFGDDFLLKICIIISKLLNKYELTTIGFEELRMDLNKYLDPYELVKPDSVGQSVNGNLHSIKDDDEANLIVKYYTLPIRNKELNNIVKKAIIESA